MSDYQDRVDHALWHELKYVYPDLVPPDERTPGERKLDAEKAIVELFGPEEIKEEMTCQSKD